MNRFANKTAIVTGAGSGLGRATAERMAQEGGAVACLDLSRAAVDDTVSTIKSAGGNARAFEVDVSRPDSVRTAVDAAVAELGRPSILVNCAGIGKFNHTVDVPFDEWSRIIGVNLTGTFLMCQTVLPHLLKGGGNIVNIASNAGLMGVAYSVAYCASKGGVIQLTRSLADEFLNKKVRVNAVAPGGMATPMQSNFQMPEGADLRKIGKLMTPLGNAEPSEVAALVAFVASDEGRYITGAILSIDGGLTI